MTRLPDEIPPLVDVLPVRWAQNGVVPRTAATRQHSMEPNSAVLETALRRSKPHMDSTERPRPATQIGVALIVTGVTMATLGLQQRESVRNGPVGTHFETAFGFAHLDHRLSLHSEWDEHLWPPADARVSLRQDSSQERKVAREVGAWRTYLLESALVVHRLPLAELQAFDPAALRGRIESEHLSEAALDSLEIVPICGTCATHKGDPT
jgi:hypothetical protein